MRIHGVVKVVSVMALAAGLSTACGDSGPSDPGGVGSFDEIQATLVSDCGACHGSGSGRLFRTSMDSAQLVNSGFVDPSNPAQSLLLLKPTNGVPHGGGAIPSLTGSDQALIADWIGQQPAPTGAVLAATKLASGMAPPAIDGFLDQVWYEAGPTHYLIGGGWADATSVQLQALYDDTYLYIRMVWADDQASIRRQPWVKQADGSWLVLPAKTPLPAAGVTWMDYMGAGFDEEDINRFNYEDKVSLMWNTYGASTVAGFDQAGCAVTCHDPAVAESPGTTYDYTDESQAAKKFTNAAGEIADLWHWKLVRNNQHVKIDDQFVQSWLRGVTGAANGGRASDAGAAGYASNPAINGRPAYRGPTATVPPYYIYDNQKVALTDPEVVAFPVGQEIPNMITSGPTLTRADIDGFAIYSTHSRAWVLEIRRALVTGDQNDVQFDDLNRVYSFGVSIFDNAQIEHSYMSTVGKLSFKP